MISIKRLTKVMSLLMTMIIVIGTFSPFAHATSDQISFSKNDLREEAFRKIEPEVMNELEKEDFVEVLVYMKDQVNTEMIAKATKNAIKDIMTPYRVKLEVRKGVVEALKDTAEKTQGDLIKYLKQQVSKGNVVEYKPYYIVNMIYVKGTRDVIENIAYRAEVERIYKNNTYQLDNVLTSSEYIEITNSEIEWNVARVGADRVWDMGFDGTGIVVGAIDSGADWTHPALQSKWRGYNPETGETDPSKSWYDPQFNSPLPQDSNIHGTHVIGTMVGSEPNGSNKVGVAPGAKWIAARVFDYSGTTTGDVLLDAAEWMLAPGGDPTAAPDIINNSWGGLDGIDNWFRGAVRAWRAAEILPVFAAGNQRPDEPPPWPGSISCPANYPESFAVAATDRNDKRASFSKLGPSPYGESLVKPDISAPGVGIRSSVPYGGYDYSDGTSMAAPAVSGVAALLLSANASLTIEDIEEILISTAEPLTDKDYPKSPNYGYGYGLVNAYEAVSLAVSGSGTIRGRVLVEGEDTQLPIINHKQIVTEVFLGSDIEITAEVSDDVSIRDVELLVKQEGSSYWMIVPMDIISGNHKSGTYQGIIPYDMLKGDSIVYKITARDYLDNIAVTEDYKIDIIFGIVPDEYTQGFEENVDGWVFTGTWEWGAPSGISPTPFEENSVAGTVLDGPYDFYADDWMITPPIDLRDTSLPTASLRFHHWYSIEPTHDSGYVLVSNDYGETWTQVGADVRGSSNGWMERVVELGDYIGSPNPVFVAFRFTSNGFENWEGWYIDNVRLMGPDSEPPATPVDLTCEHGLTGVKLSWRAVSDPDLSHYNIFRSETPGGQYEKIGEARSNRFIDTSVLANTTYYYVINAEDTSGNTSDYSNEVTITVLETTILFGADFENNDGGFTKGVIAGTANDWEWGVPKSGPNEAFSGEKLWATNLDGDYTANNDSYIESPPIEIPADKNAILTFTHWYDFEGTAAFAWDYGEVHISRDDGASWENITPRSEGRFGGREQQWITEEIPLSQYSGDTIRIRFYFHSDYIIYYSGWYIDDVYVIGLDSSEGFSFGVSESFEASNANPMNSSEPKFSLRKPEENKYKTISDEELVNIPMGSPGIPAADAIVTVIETGKSVVTDPVTGRFTIRVPYGEYTLRAEAYGYYDKEVKVKVEDNEDINMEFFLDPMPRGSIKGRVIDRYYGNPASYAVVRIMEDTKVASVVADAEGYFTIPDVIIGDYTLDIRAEGFEQGKFPVTVMANEQTEIEVGLKKLVFGHEQEIAYDDGTAEDATVLNSAGYGVAVRFTPDRLIKVVGVNTYIWGSDWPIPGGNRIGYTIYGTDEKGNPYQVGEPIFVDVVRGEWNYIDLSSFGFSTDRDFYISTIQYSIGEESPGVGIDMDSEHPRRSYLNLGGIFQLISSSGTIGGLMMRAVVANSLSTPVITNLKEVVYTDQDIITLEGRVEVDTKVNIYANDEIIVTLDTENKEFKVDVELPLDENIIMATAEYDGIETEPCPAIKVIKDKVAPVLVVYEPMEGTVINKESVCVIGNVIDEVGLASLTINGEEIEVDEEGNFNHRIIVNEGENLISIVATDFAGHVTTVERMVTVKLETPQITNMMPNEDIVLMTGDKMTVSFNAEPGGEGYFRLISQYNPLGNEVGLIPMKEIEPGLYAATITLPEGFKIQNGLVEFVFTDEAGNRVTAIAPGRVTVIDESVEPMEDLPVNAVIVGDEAYDINYLNTNSDAQMKLINYFNEGNEIYVKLGDDLIVNTEGEIVGMDVLPDELTYYDADGRTTKYVK